VFYLLRMPLPWMLGAMAATAAASIAGLPVAMLRSLRTVMVVVLGVMLGSAFTPEILARAGEWLLTLAGLFVYIVATGGVTYVYFRRVAGYGPITAFFTAMPGGLNEMILVGSAMGGDERLISLTHGARVLLVVFALVFGFRLFGDFSPSGTAGVNPGLLAIAPVDLAILAVCGLIGALLARMARLPAGPLLGAMILSALAHLLGLTASRPPSELVAVAQVVVGAAVGCRFAGVPVRMVATTAAHAAVGSVLMVAVAAILGGLLYAVTDIPLSALLLAYAPGGLAEMSLVAIALGLDAAFVATHHVVRIAIVVTLAPTFFRIVGGRRGLPAEAPRED